MEKWQSIEILHVDRKINIFNVFLDKSKKNALTPKVNTRRYIKAFLKYVLTGVDLGMFRR